VKKLNGFACQRMETSTRRLEARELTFWYDQNWQNNWLAEKLHHFLERILTSRGTYWHTNLLRIKNILDHSVTINLIIYWVTFAKFFHFLLHDYLFVVLDFYVILYMLICFRTLQMDRLEVNIHLISACLQDQECPRFICQPITVSIATTPAVFENAH
jgi:hypothetical protein